MSQIKEVIYLPSLRCNLNCQHCGENQDVKKEDEINCLHVLESLKNSYLFIGKTISITGGEPFLNEYLPEFLVKGINETDYSFYITSNGFFEEAIKKLIERVDFKDRNRLIFSISIDGLEETHNEIRRNGKSFQNAVETIRFLVKNNVPIYVNTVAQEKNLSELEQLKAYISGISNSIIHSIIPLSVDISEDKANIYTNRYKQIVWNNVTSAVDRKRVLSNGTYCVKRCHAGLNNIVIASDGKVYPCLTGGFYKGLETRKRFCLGDLKTNSLDEILISERRKEVDEKEVLQCKGCSNPCEVNREVNLFKQELTLREDEVECALSLDTTRLLGDALLDYSGWYDVELYGLDKLCWSNSKMARVFLPNDGRRRIIIKFRMLVPETKVKILVNGKETVNCKCAQNNILELILPELGEAYYIIDFLLESIYCPYELKINDDMRPLGIGLENVKLLKE